MSPMGLLAEFRDYFKGEGTNPLNGKFHISDVDKVTVLPSQARAVTSSDLIHSMVAQGHELHHIGFGARVNVYYCAHISWL